MKIQFPIILIPFLAVTACTNEKSAASGPAIPGTDSPQAATTAPAATAAETDPVCGMVRDSTWTDYTVREGDTIWFCAAPEKAAFLANPQKYLHAAAAHDHNSHQ